MLIRAKRLKLISSVGEKIQALQGRGGLGGYWGVPSASPRLTINRQPIAQTGEEGQRVVMRVGVHSALLDPRGASTVYYQWQRNGVDIVGATGLFYISPILTALDDGAQYRVIVRTVDGDMVVSDTALLTVVSSDTPASLQIHKLADGSAVISWERSGFLLQRTDTLPGLWEPASTQVSPAVVPPPSAEEFFRLIRK